MQTKTIRGYLRVLGTGKYRQVPVNRAEVGQNHDVRKVVLATLSVFKWSGLLFRSRRSKVCVQKVFLFPFHCKQGPARVSLEWPGLENISQVSGNRAEVEQNHAARNVVSATVSVLKWSVAIFRPTSSKVSVQKVLLCPFNCKTRPSTLKFSVQGTGKCSPSSGRSTRSLSKS